MENAFGPPPRSRVNCNGKNPSTNGSEAGKQSIRPRKVSAACGEIKPGTPAPLVLANPNVPPNAQPNLAAFGGTTRATGAGAAKVTEMLPELPKSPTPPPHRGGGGRERKLWSRCCDGDENNRLVRVEIFGREPVAFVV